MKFSRNRFLQSVNERAMCSMDWHEILFGRHSLSQKWYFLIWCGSLCIMLFHISGPRSRQTLTLQPDYEVKTALNLHLAGLRPQKPLASLRCSWFVKRLTP